MRKIIVYLMIIATLIPFNARAYEKMYEYENGRLYGIFDSEVEAVYRFALISRSEESEDPIMWDRVMDDYYFAMLDIIKLEQDGNIVRAYCNGDINGILELEKEGNKYTFYKLYVYDGYEFELKNEKKFKDYKELVRGKSRAYEDYYITRFDYLQNERHNGYNDYNIKVLKKITNDGYTEGRLKYWNVSAIKDRLYHNIETIEGYFIYYNANGFEYDTSNVDIIKYEAMGENIKDGLKAIIVQNVMYPEYDDIKKEYRIKR